MNTVDFHTHTNISDGALRPENLFDLASNCGINTLAITDHNSTCDLTQLCTLHPEIRLIQGTEISCRYDGHEIHVVGLGFDPTHPEIKEVFRQNNPDRHPYIEAILERLRACSIDVGTYEDIQRAYPDSKHFGRQQIASRMVQMGYCKTPTAALDEYIGSFGKRRAYVENPLEYVSMEQAITAILRSGGVPVLAHLFYYKMNYEENLRLIRTFKALAGDRAAMEVEYGAYSRLQRDFLKELAATAVANGVMASAGSDYHGVNPKETLLDQCFDHACISPLLEALGIKED